jgi:hypothetical protein
MVEPTSAASLRERHLAQLIAAIKFAERRRGPGPQATGFSSDGVLRIEELARYRTSVAPGSHGTATVGELADLSPTAFLARHLETRVDYQKDASGNVVPVPVRVLGEVPYASEVAYVVYVRVYEADPANAAAKQDDPLAAATGIVEVLPVLRRGDRWHMGLNVELSLVGPEMMLEILGDAPPGLA